MHQHDLNTCLAKSLHSRPPQTLSITHRPATSHTTYTTLRPLWKKVNIDPTLHFDGMQRILLLEKDNRTDLLECRKMKLQGSGLNKTCRSRIGRPHLCAFLKTTALKGLSFFLNTLTRFAIDFAITHDLFVLQSRQLMESFGESAFRLRIVSAFCP